MTKLKQGFKRLGLVNQGQLEPELHPDHLHGQTAWSPTKTLNIKEADLPPLMDRVTDRPEVLPEKKTLLVIAQSGKDLPVVTPTGRSLTHVARPRHQLGIAVDLNPPHVPQEGDQKVEEKIYSTTCCIGTANNVLLVMALTMEPPLAVTIYVPGVG